MQMDSIQAYSISLRKMVSPQWYSILNWISSIRIIVYPTRSCMIGSFPSHFHQFANSHWSLTNNQLCNHSTPLSLSLHLSPSLSLCAICNRVTFVWGIYTIRCLHFTFFNFNSPHWNAPKNCSHTIEYDTTNADDVEASNSFSLFFLIFFLFLSNHFRLCTRLTRQYSPNV